MAVRRPQKNSSFLAPVPFYWCDRCHAPVMGRVCACGNAARPVSVTPPGDVRPAFPRDRALVNRLFEAEFGVPLIPDDQIAILNKVPDEDRMEEIVLGGAVVCAVRYLPAEERWEVLPREAAASVVQPVKRIVRVTDEAAGYIKEGSSVLMPGVTYVSPEIREGDPVFVLSESGECVAVGRSKMSAEEAASAERGQLVRTRRTQKPVIDVHPSSWEGAIAANETILNTYEEKSVAFIRDVMAKNPDVAATISYSGGKDSLVTLLLTLKAGLRLPMIFADTGLEFPETVQNVHEVSETYGLPLYTQSGADGFWKEFAVNGPPAVDFRWCCKSCKLSPVKTLIESTWGEALSFIGQRKFESAKRLQSPRVWRNKNVPCQISAAPIQHWTAMHDWLYLFREKAPYNPLYEIGLDRIGCFMCPSSDIACMKDIAARYPEMWEMWEERVRVWGDANGKPEEWAAKHQWRIREKAEEDSDMEGHY
ncbi:MAG TPA: phosphoadenosine phosphosulfate reductase family protein [Methanocorpusculum sp.]|nr:phosphoadenosine phosphosulfate reductase family protein [Candidatus Methanocorpusculum equi]MCQ2357995.1 phosphoadenosine phosphosulfate reductase family protein [Methanocorpusculum sp.]HJJ44821.1 phosphoadenosine phosphosulfate reductase family protein [Methanocorpusculum sp.]HJJ58225.1 phosphoadenosine phosphosulfate reductase family protein [Methanocorpusculum sp.]HJJ59525.1 phosphoadenosine phosphosulfate reductase family protein [Methanocorpusculum sp.]